MSNDMSARSFVPVDVSTTADTKRRAAHSNTEADPKPRVGHFFASGRKAMRSNPLFNDAYIAGRWEELLRLFELFKPVYEQENGGSVTLFIDEVSLYQAVVSYFHDISRYKWWHFPENPAAHRVDDTKKSAYMVYWLNKLRPIYVERTAEDPSALATSLANDTSIIVNSLFSLTVSYSYLEFVFSDEIAEQLLYVLTYRSTDHNALIFIFEMVIHIRDGKEVILAG
jgi:hypothetical protein